MLQSSVDSTVAVGQCLLPWQRGCIDARDILRCCSHFSAVCMVPRCFASNWLLSALASISGMISPRLWLSPVPPTHPPTHPYTVRGLQYRLSEGDPPRHHVLCGLLGHLQVIHRRPPQGGVHDVHCGGAAGRNRGWRWSRGRAWVRIGLKGKFGGSAAGSLAAWRAQPGGHRGQQPASVQVFFLAPMRVLTNSHGEEAGEKGGHLDARLTALRSRVQWRAAGCSGERGGQPGVLGTVTTLNPKASQH